MTNLSTDSNVFVLQHMHNCCKQYLCSYFYFSYIKRETSV